MIFAVHQHRARGDGVIGMAGDHLGEGAFAGAVRPHDGVDFAPRHREREPADDLLFADRDVQIFDGQLLHIGPETYPRNRLFANARGLICRLRFPICELGMRSRQNTPWCNGNTAPFGGVIHGSNPCGVAHLFAT